MDRQYTVALRVDARLPIRQRIEAECHFVEQLERELGCPEAVIAAYGAWAAAADTQDVVDESIARLAARWPRAYERATGVTLRKLEIADAVFDFKPEARA